MNRVHKTLTKLLSKNFSHRYRKLLKNYGFNEVVYKPDEEERNSLSYSSVLSVSLDAPGIYVIKAQMDKTFNDEWSKFAKDRPIPKINKDNENTSYFLYIGKSSSKPLEKRIKEHFTLDKNNKSTYALRINEFNGLKITECLFFELKDDAAPDNMKDTYISLFESILHQSLKPRVGSSR